MAGQQVFISSLGAAKQGSRAACREPKPQQLHKLAVPQPDLFRRQVRPVHAGIRKQPSFSAVAALASSSSRGNSGQALSSSPNLTSQATLFSILALHRHNTKVPSFGNWMEGNQVERSWKCILQLNESYFGKFL